jgi:signal transduction histidine kinase
MDCLRNLPPWSKIDPSHLPERLHTALTESQGSMLIRLNDRHIETIPDNGLLYSLEPPAEILDSKTNGLHLVDSVLIAPHLSSKKTPSSGEPKSRILWKKAEQLHRDGRKLEAIAAYEDLKQYPQESLGAVPSALIADFEICTLLQETRQMKALGKNALVFYGDLVRGRWRLEKPRYRFYSASAREWLQAAGFIDELKKLSSLEDLRSKRTQALESLVSLTGSSLTHETGMPKVLQTADGIFLVLMHRPIQQEPSIALMLSPATLTAQLWPAVFSKGTTDKWIARLTSPDGVPLYATDSRAIPTQLNAVRTISVAGVRWTLDVWPKQVAQLHTELQHRQRVYMAILALFSVSLIFAIYFSIRMLFREVELARMKADFVATVSHEFRTPLTGIRQLTEMLAADRVPEDQRRSQYYSMILRETEQLSRMVENILAAARGTEKRRPFRMEMIDTDRWLRGVAAQFLQSAAVSRSNVIFGDIGPLPHIKGDPEALSLVLTNLIDNAIKYSPENALSKSTQRRAITG